MTGYDFVLEIHFEAKIGHHIHYCGVFCFDKGIAFPIAKNVFMNKGRALAAPVAPTWYQDVKPVFDRKCLSCHGEGGLSGISFASWEDAWRWRTAIGYAVDSGRMPIWLAAPGHREYEGDLSLSADEKQKILDWVATGAARGDPADERVVEPGWTDLEGDLVIDILKEPYLPAPERSDDYHCFVADWPLEQDSYMVAEQIVPGNTKIDHHTMAYLVEPDLREYIHRFEKEEPGQGYGCQSGILPDRLMNPADFARLEREDPGIFERLQKGYQIVGIWAPGIRANFLPPGTGIRIPVGSVLVFQMHYWTAGAEGERDAGTRMKFSLQDRVDTPLYTHMLTNDNWYRGRQNRSMVIPYGERHRFDSSRSLREVAAKARRHLRASPVANQLRLYSSYIHMHSYGINAMAWLENEGGEREVLLEIPRWDLSWQRTFQFRQPLVYDLTTAGEDLFTVSCEFENRGNLNPGPGERPGEPLTVYGGVGSNDEMCINYTLVSLTE